MKIGLFFVAYIVCQLVSAVDIQYDILPEASAPNPSSLSYLNTLFLESNFSPLDKKNLGLIPGLNVDQVWRGPQSHQFVYLKLGVAPNEASKAKSTELLPFLDGYLWHQQLITGSQASLFFKGMSLTETQKIIATLSAKKTDYYFLKILLPNAYAANSCDSHHSIEKDLDAFSKNLSTSSPSMNWSLTQCMFTSLSSASEAVRKTVSLETLKKIFRTPSQIYGEAVKTAEKLFELNGEIARGIQKALSQGITTQELEEMFPLVCSAAGTIFSGTLMAMITAGAGSASFRILLEALTNKMSFAKRLSSLKLQNGPEILSCVVQASSN